MPLKVFHEGSYSTNNTVFFPHLSSGDFYGNHPELKNKDIRYNYRMDDRERKVKFIRSRMKELGYNQRSLALAAGLHQDGVRNLFRGKSKNWRSDTYIAIMKIIDPSNSYNPTEQKDSLYDQVTAYDVKASAGPGRLLSRENVLYKLSFRSDWLRKLTTAPADKLAIIGVDGDSMEPTLSPGDTVLIDTTQTNHTKDGIYFIQFDGDGLIKRIQYNPQMKSIRLISDNSKYPPLEITNPSSFKILGRALWTGRRL